MLWAVKYEINSRRKERDLIILFIAIWLWMFDWLLVKVLRMLIKDSLHPLWRERLALIRWSMKRSFDWDLIWRHLSKWQIVIIEKINLSPEESLLGGAILHSLGSWAKKVMHHFQCYFDEISSFSLEYLSCHDWNEFFPRTSNSNWHSFVMKIFCLGMIIDRLNSSSSVNTGGFPPSMIDDDRSTTGVEFLIVLPLPAFRRECFAFWAMCDACT